MYYALAALLLVFGRARAMSGAHTPREIQINISTLIFWKNYSLTCSDPQSLMELVLGKKERKKRNWAWCRTDNSTQDCHPQKNPPFL